MIQNRRVSVSPPARHRARTRPSLAVRLLEPDRLERADRLLGRAAVTATAYVLLRPTGAQVTIARREVVSEHDLSREPEGARRGLGVDAVERPPRAQARLGVARLKRHLGGEAHEVDEPTLEPFLERVCTAAAPRCRRIAATNLCAVAVFSSFATTSSCPNAATSSPASRRKRRERGERGHRHAAAVGTLEHDVPAARLAHLDERHLFHTDSGARHLERILGRRHGAQARRPARRRTRFCRRAPSRSSSCGSPRVAPTFRARARIAERASQSGRASGPAQNASIDKSASSASLADV